MSDTTSGSAVRSSRSRCVVSDPPSWTGRRPRGRGRRRSPVGLGHGGEAVSDLLQDPVELAVLRHQLVEVHPVGADPGRQRREEELVLVGVVGDELFPIPVEVLADSRRAAHPGLGVPGSQQVA